MNESNRVTDATMLMAEEHTFHANFHIKLNSGNCSECARAQYN